MTEEDQQAGSVISDPESPPVGGSAANEYWNLARPDGASTHHIGGDLPPDPSEGRASVRIDADEVTGTSHDKSDSPVVQAQDASMEDRYSAWEEEQRRGGESPAGSSPGLIDGGSSGRLSFTENQPSIDDAEAHASGLSRSARIDVKDGDQPLAAGTSLTTSDAEVAADIGPQETRLDEDAARTAFDASYGHRKDAVNQAGHGKRGILARDFMEHSKVSHAQADLIEKWAIRLHSGELNPEVISKQPDLIEKLKGKSPAEQAAMLAELEWYAGEFEREVQEYLSQAAHMIEKMKSAKEARQLLGSVIKPTASDPDYKKPETEAWRPELG